MFPAVVRAVPATALVCCALAAAPAHAQTAASPTPESQPQLTGKPPVALGAATATPAPGSTPVAATTAAAAATPAPGDALPRTGADAGLLALAGASLLGMGLSLRRLVEPHGAV